MNSRIAHHATLAHFIRARLELWFDKREQTPPRPDKAERYIQHFGKRNEACVTYRDVDRLGNKLGAQMPGVGPIKDNNARIAPQLPRKLSVSDVDRLNRKSVVSGKSVSVRLDVGGLGIC